MAPINLGAKQQGDFMKLRNIALPILIFMTTMLSASTALAISLDEAKAKGLVGELRNGYLGAVLPSPGPDVQALINDINGKRKAQYQAIAGRNGTPLNAVEKVAAEKAISLTSPGNYFQTPQGSWAKK